MRLPALFVELIDRLLHLDGEPVFFGNVELKRWPVSQVRALKSAGFLTMASPASSTVCPGCERDCVMGVHVLPAVGSRPARAFIVCDKPEDLGRIPVELDNLEQWGITRGGLAEAVGRLLGCTESPREDATTKHWHLGVLNTKEIRGAVRLSVNDDITLSVGYLLNSGNPNLLRSGLAADTRGHRRAVVFGDQATALHPKTA